MAGALNRFADRCQERFWLVYLDRRIRHHVQNSERVETGSIQFGDDWPGIFLRGDDALPYSFFLTEMLNRVAEHRKAHPDAEVIDSIQEAQLRGLVELLASTDSRVDDPRRRLLKPYQECRLKNP